MQEVTVLSKEKSNVYGGRYDSGEFSNVEVEYDYNLAELHDEDDYDETHGTFSIPTWICPLNKIVVGGRYILDVWNHVNVSRFELIKEAL